MAYLTGFTLRFIRILASLLRFLGRFFLSFTIQLTISAFPWLKVSIAPPYFILSSYIFATLLSSRLYLVVVVAGGVLGSSFVRLVLARQGDRRRLAMDYPREPPYEVR